MPPTGNVRFIKQRDLDRSRWDAAVASDASSLPYGFSWWLDAVAGHHWDGMVLGDYRAVLPLTQQVKLGLVKTISRPPFTQQVGPWGTINEGELSTLLSAIPSSFIQVDIPITFNHQAESIPEKFRAERRTNFTLDLSPPYDLVRAGYKKSLSKRLRRYAAAGTLAPVDAATVIDLYQSGPGEKAGLTTKHYDCIIRLIEAAYEANAGSLIGYQNEQGALLAAGFFPKYGQRLINLFAASTELGYTSAGMSRLLDALIRQYAGSKMLFDFEGSDLAGVAEYFKKFGPVNQPYLRIKRGLW